MHSIPAAWARFAGAGLLLIVGAAGSACAHSGSGAASQNATAQTNASAAVVVQSQDACPVVLERNGTLELHLGGNPSTGYAWQITNGATGVLTARGEPTQSEGSGVPGSPAEYVFHFDATAAGSGQLSLAYRQAWDTAAAPAATFECAITVR